MPYLKKLKHTTLFPLLLISAFFLFPPTAYSAKLPLGARCMESHECGTNLGCRKAEAGDFSVCKITVPGTPGCESDVVESSPATGDSFCADGMICRKNRCVPSYGIEDITNSRIQAPIIAPPENPAIRLPSGVAIREYATVSTARKILSLALAVSLLIGMAFVLKGWLAYRVAIGFIPGERKAMKLAGIGAALVLASIILWLLFARF